MVRMKGDDRNSYQKREIGKKERERASELRRDPLDYWLVFNVESHEWGGRGEQ